MKRNIRIFMFVIIILLVSKLASTAQITIGSGYAPAPGALLDLKEFQDAESEIGGRTAVRGLLLPRVVLTDLNTLGDISGVEVGDEINHTSLTVYNIQSIDCIPVGVYVWNGNKWQAVWASFHNGQVTDSLALVDLYKANPQSQTALGWDLLKPMDTWAGVKIEGVGCENRRVTQLKISSIIIGELAPTHDFGSGSNQTLKIIPVSVGNMTALNTLWLNGHAISNVPGKIENLVELVDLQLNSNLLTRLPSEITKLQKLETLYLGENDLRVVPNEIFQIQRLKYLDLSSNNISILPDQMRNISSLMFLIVDDNNLTSLPSGTWTCTGLKDLNVSSNKLTSIPDGLWSLLETNINVWERFNISDNKFQGQVLPVWIIDKLPDNRFIVCPNTYTNYNCP